MKLRILGWLQVAAAVVVLLVNAVVVTHIGRSAAPFGGGHVLALDGPDLNVREYGPPGDRAVVLLHGYSASIEWWEKVAPALAANGRVIAVDFVGHGGSEAPTDAAPYHADGQADAVHRALQALGVRHTALVGHSMGGKVAAALAAEYPEMVGRVVVSDTLAADDLAAMPLLGRMVCWPVVGPAMDRFRGVDAIIDSSLQTGFAADFPVPQFAHRSLEQLAYAGVCDSKATGRPVAETLKRLGKPVLVLRGDRDVLTPTGANVARYTAVGLPPHIIEGSGHSPMVEKPDQFLSATSDFVH
ncbi:alpha/beta hydrolase [Mycobacterium sp. OTB74]|jgi:pimeloyl-ACP methyl ester carboxylesterase|uniref:alpha/beta fold hydrolase n=1 Tax=Mycobacterium sp. OTB74 TaxID=1853452 RepID=UPI00247427EA|nr:alpha/beta hydrolase [Mycobacterium sp. OTB74]MDH6243480.1 pimeloyl-ACP methyl ester carboxylesterase [Mycobacterium sp. OTB74]